RAWRADLRPAQLQDQHHHRRRARDPDGDPVRPRAARDPAICDTVAAGEADMIDPTVPLASLGGAIDFIFHQRSSLVPGGTPVGGPAEVWHLTWAQLEVSGLALAGSIVLALPVGVWLGHKGRGEFFAVAFGNAGRALPE